MDNQPPFIRVNIEDTQHWGFIFAGVLNSAVEQMTLQPSLYLYLDIQVFDGKRYLMGYLLPKEKGERDG